MASCVFVFSRFRGPGAARAAGFTASCSRGGRFVIEVDDRLLGMVVSPNGSLLAVVTGSNFNPRALHLIDIASRTLKQTISISNSVVGVAFSPAGDRIYVGGGASNDVKFFKAAPDGSFAADGTIPISGGSAPSGLSLSANGSRLSVTNGGGKVPGPTDFTDGTFPVVVDRRTGIPVSGTVSVINTASNAVVKTIDVGLHPTGMALSPTGDRVYVTNANSDTVSVIDTSRDAVVDTLHVGEEGAWRAPVLGSSPNAVTVSPDGRTLYVANAARNAIAVVDANARNGDADSAIRGLIPTGWYPTAVALDARGEQLFIASGYGFGSIAPVPAGEGRSYTDRAGVVSILDVPNRGELMHFTEEVHRNNKSLPALDAEDHDHGGWGSSPIPMHQGQASPIA